MTGQRIAETDIVDALFDGLEPLRSLSGYERDKTRETARRLIEPLIEVWFARSGHYLDGEEE